MGLVDSANGILDGIRRKIEKAEGTGERPRYLILGAVDYSLVCGAVALSLDGGDGTHAGEDVKELFGLTVVQAYTLRLLEVGW